MADTKTCSKCGLDLDLSEFSKRATGNLNARCKTCCRGAVRIQKICVICGSTFPATDKSTKIFCSAECKRQNDKNKQSEKYANAREVRVAEEELHRQKNRQDYPEIFDQFSALPSSKAEANQKGESLFFTGLKCKNGHLAPKRAHNSLCIECADNRNKESYDRFKNSERYKIQLKEQGAKNKKRRAEDPTYRKEVNERSKRWADKNRDRLADYMKKQRAENPQYIMRDRLQSRLKFVLKNAGNKKSDTLEKYLGCSSKELGEWIESQFTNEMTWDNKDTWNVDHVRPCASFDLTDEVQAKVCFNWRNLKPLGESENKSKKDFYEPHDEVEWARRMRELGYDGELFLLFEEGRGGLYGQETAGEVDT